MSSLDKFALDEECIRQTELMDEAVEECIKAVEDYNEADMELKQRESELDQEIREDPESFGISKLTEGSVKAAITRETEELSKKLAKAESRKYAAILRKEKVIARGNELKNLINLYLNDYYVKGHVARMEEAAGEVSTKQLMTAKSTELTDRLSRAKKIKADKK
jgi:CHASE3 domain sensor protein